MIDAIVIDERDNVSTALHELEPGQVTTNRGVAVTLDKLGTGHKFALTDISPGESIIKYGEPVGVATSAIVRGGHVHVHNVGDILPKSREHRPDASSVSVAPREPREGSWDREWLRGLTFNGYARPDGRVGVRNLVLVVATVGCANAVVDRIARQTGAVGITHQQGCLQLGRDLKLTEKQLIGAASNPNVGAVLFVGLGCETIQARRLLGRVQGKLVDWMTIQDQGGSRKALDRGIALVREMQEQLDRAVREPFPLSKLVVGTKCGGSDGLSGLTANPATGVAADMLLDAGAAVVLSETPGLFGSEPHLAARMGKIEDRERLSSALDNVWEESLRLGELLSEGELSPGNMEGGLTTLVEKSLGATVKAGTRPFTGFLEFADQVPGSGLWLMDTPGFDIITISGQAAGGAQIILFTTGRGSPVGCAIASVIKVCSNSQTFEWMEEDMDVNAGAIVDGGKTLEEVGAEILEAVVKTANGELTKSESWGHTEYALARIGSTL